MNLLLVIRLLFVCNTLHIGESYAKKCTTNENDKNLKVRHRWSPWTDWSPCTRPCGIGIQQRNRTCHMSCRRKRRKNGCVGPSTMHRVCNTQDCTGERVDDILSEQCSAFNNRTFAGKSYTWLPFQHLGRECSLHCRPLGQRFFAELSSTAADGTPCGKNSYCLKGKCMEAGCNNVLGYTQTNCHGKNVSYHRTRGIFTQPHLKYGYNYIATIPSSARNISISQHRLTSNHIVLMKNDGSYVINGNWVVNQPGNFIDCGTVFTYHRNTDSAGSLKEYVYSPGPLNQPIQLLLLAFEVNGGITYEYDTPIANSSLHIDDQTNDAALMSTNSVVQQRVNHDRNNTIPNEDVSSNRRRHWQKHYIWRTCQKSCGDTTYEAAVCVHHSTEMIVPEKQCFTLKKPVQEDYRCNTTNKPCLPEWVPSEWSPCSVTCGEGVHLREVACKQLTTSGYPITLNGKACSISPPLTIKKCNLKSCDAANPTKTWDVGQWSKCSSSCGEGYRTRTVICRSTKCHTEDVPPSKESCYSVCPTQVGMWLTSQWSTKASKVEMQPSFYKYCSEKCGSGWQMRNVICFGDNECNSAEQQKLYQTCRSDESCSGQWFTGPWQMCSGVCGEGNQKRDVVCLRKLQNEFLSVPEHNCKLEEKPVSIQRCKLPECSATWYTTEWSMCSKSCGSGVQHRKVYCVKKNLESNLCSENDKPPKSQPCNTHFCNAAFIKDNDCTDKHKHCQKAVVQARLCNYSYYKNLCCQSCSDKN